ncbi:hypothetical protein GCM10010359_10750 [Streptomyces morookaense]|nr:MULTISPECIES: LCP family protein [Streptomyces]GHF11034.1 hypothetical protein GCM10010359_10750 [Streptomyces morookaense]
MNHSPGRPRLPDGPLSEGPDGRAGLSRRRRWLRWLAGGTALLVLAVAGIGWVLYEQLNSNIHTDDETAAELRRWEKERPQAMVNGAQNILIIGSDTRSGAGNSRYGEDSGSQRSDTTILLHLAADRHSATAVSLPRDLMATIPRCRKPDGSYTNERFAQFNWAYELAGTACTIRTVEGISRVRIDHHIVLDFSGFKRLVDAVDGVEVCLKKPVDDREAHLTLPAGRQVLHGEQALGFVRARYSIGDGSDTERMGRQQLFMGALFQEMQSDGVLLNPARLYPVLDAATKSLTTDSGLDSLRKMYDLVRTVRNIPSSHVQFLTVPRKPYPYNSDRDELVQPDADQLFEQLRMDRPVTVSEHVRPADGKPDGRRPPRAPRDDEPDPADVSDPGTGVAPEPPAAHRSILPSAPAAPTTGGRSQETAEPSPMPSTRPDAPPTYEGTTAARGICG